MDHLGLKAALALGLVALALVCAGCEQLPGEAPPTPTLIPTVTPVPKAVFPVERGDIEDLAPLLGVVDSQRRVNVFFRVGGRLKGFYVLPGDNVTEGQLLAELEVGLLPFELSTAQTDLDITHLRLEKTLVAQETETADAQRRVDAAERRLAQVLAANSDPDLADARSALETAEAELTKARRAYYKLAASQGASNTPEAGAFEQATLRYKHARRAYDMMVELMILEHEDLAFLEEDIQLARSNLARLSAGHEDEVMLLEKEIELAEIQVERLRAQLDETKVTAPFSGVVLYAVGDMGDAVEEFEPVLGVADSSVLEVRSKAPSVSIADKLRVRQEAIIVFRDYPDQQVAGELIQVIAPLRSDESESALLQAEARLPIRVAFSAPNLDLEIGTLADVIVVVERKENVLIIPNSTIHSYFNRRYVLVKDDDRKVEVDVELGVSDGERTEVVAGLEEGELVFER